MLPGHEVRVGGALVHLQQVGAGAERPAVAGQQHHRDPGVLGGREQRLGGGVVERLVEGVEGVGAVEGDGADPMVVRDLSIMAPNVERVPASGGRLRGRVNPSDRACWRPAWPCPVGSALPAAPPRRRRPDLPGRRPRPALARTAPPRARRRSPSRRGRPPARSASRPGGRARSGHWSGARPARRRDSWAGFEPGTPCSPRPSPPPACPARGGADW